MVGSGWGIRGEEKGGSNWLLGMSRFLESPALGGSVSNHDKNSGDGIRAGQAAETRRAFIGLPLK